MESAFGIEHGEVSKAMSPNKAAAFARENAKLGRLTRKGNYAGHKLSAKRWGAEKAKSGSNPTGYYIDGPTSGRLGRDQLSDLNGKKNRRLP